MSQAHEEITIAQWKEEAEKFYLPANFSFIWILCLFSPSTFDPWYAFLQRVNALACIFRKELMPCTPACDVKSGSDPLPFWLGCEKKMFGFSQLSKSIKWQDLLEKGKDGRNAFRTGAKIHFSEKKHCGYGHFKRLHPCLFSCLQ